jgi:excisionase family DNA binding protein
MKQSLEVLSSTSLQSARESTPLPKLLFSQKEAARILGISLRTLQNLITAREISVRRIGRRVLIYRKDLEMFARRDHAVIGVAS